MANKTSKPCHVYILEGKDGSLYTGVTIDVEARIAMHNGERLGGAKYTKTRRPWKFVYSEKCASKGEALKREYEIKHRFTKEEKRALVNSFSKDDLLSAI